MPVPPECTRSVGRGRAMHMRMVVGPGEPVGGLLHHSRGHLVGTYCIILWDGAYLSCSIAVPEILCQWNDGTVVSAEWLLDRRLDDSGRKVSERTLRTPAITYLL